MRAIPTCTCTPAEFERWPLEKGPFVGLEISVEIDVTFHHAAVVALGGKKIMRRRLFDRTQAEVAEVGHDGLARSKCNPV